LPFADASSIDGYAQKLNRAISRATAAPGHGAVSLVFFCRRAACAERTTPPPPVRPPPRREGYTARRDGRRCWAERRWSGRLARCLGCGWIGNAAVLAVAARPDRRGTAKNYDAVALVWMFGYATGLIRSARNGILVVMAINDERPKIFRPGRGTSRSTMAGGTGFAMRVDCACAARTWIRARPVNVFGATPNRSGPNPVFQGQAGTGVCHFHRQTGVADPKYR